LQDDVVALFPSQNPTFKQMLGDRHYNIGAVKRRPGRLGSGLWRSSPMRTKVGPMRRNDVKRDGRWRTLKQT
jgi:hypothetical protein